MVDPVPLRREALKALLYSVKYDIDEFIQIVAEDLVEAEAQTDNYRCKLWDAEDRIRALEAERKI